MSTLAYIKFITEQDYRAGFDLLHELFTIGVEDEIVCVPMEALQILDNNGVCYMIATGAMGGSARRRTWRFTTSSQPAG